MTEKQSREPDAFIDEVLRDLGDANQTGDIACLVMIAFKSDGSSSRLLHGNIDPVLLMGSIELLKGFVAGREFQGCDRK